MDPKTLRCEDVPEGTRTITPAGELDSTLTASLRRLLAAALEDGIRRVIVDLSEISYIDTSAIAMLMDADARARRLKARIMVVSPPQSRAATIFQLTKVDQVMSILGTRDEALRAA